MDTEDHLAVSSCSNCGADLPEAASYCPSCGQKVASARVTVRDMLSDFFTHILNFEYAIFPTLRDMFIPGKLSIAYFKGERKKYVSPIRLFFLTAILIIAAISLQVGNGKNAGNGLAQLKETIDKRYQRHLLLAELDSARSRLQRDRPGLPVTSLFDTLIGALPLAQDTTLRDSVNINRFISFAPLTKSPLDQVGIRDFHELSPNEIIEKYEVKDFWSKVIAKQQIKFYKNSGSLFRYFAGKAIWGAIVMMPVFAFLLKVLYIRRKFYFVEHLVFVFHTHAVIFTLTSLYIFLQAILHENADGIPVLLSIVFVVWSMKVYYRQNLVKTIIKFLIANFFYFLLLIVFAIITLLISFLLF